MRNVHKVFYHTIPYHTWSPCSPSLSPPLLASHRERRPSHSSTPAHTSDPHNHPKRRSTPKESHPRRYEPGQAHPTCGVQQTDMDDMFSLRYRSIHEQGTAGQHIIQEIRGGERPSENVFLVLSICQRCYSWLEDLRSSHLATCIFTCTRHLMSCFVFVSPNRLRRRNPRPHPRASTRPC